MQPVCKSLSVGVLCSEKRRDQFRFMWWTASDIFTDVRLYGRDGLRAVPRIIWLRDKEKNGTAWKQSLPKLDDGSSRSSDPIPNAAFLASFYPGRRRYSRIWLRQCRVRIDEVCPSPDRCWWASFETDFVPAHLLLFLLQKT